ncbi:MAG: hypothetical protein AAFZ91_12425 [Pseudomonadota bacterium]
MKSIKFSLAAALSTAIVGSAVAQAVGTVSSLPGELGSVLVTRGGSTYSLSAGDPLFEGDVITTRSDGSVSLNAFGCAQSLSSSATVTVSAATFCETTPVVVEQPAAGGTNVAGGGGAGGGSGVGLGLAAGAAAITIAAVSSGGDDDDDTAPVSP